MIFKIITLTAFLGVCQAIDHAYSAQSIVRYDDHKHEHHVVPVITKVSVPVVTKIVPVEHYVSQGSSHGHEGHHATSSQHIQRQDIPAHPPKGFFDNHGHPKYEFAYKVEDPHTGDSKYQHEARDGDVVKGVYSLHEADGSIRTVEYGSDKKTGFTADVKQTTKHQEPKYHHHHH